jgi:hypothetical protein
VTLDDLVKNAGVLPISEDGLRSVLEDLHDAQDLPPDEFIFEARYALRAIGALLPPEKFDVITIGEVVGVNAIIHSDEMLEVLNATGELEGEATCVTVRNLIGLVDDCVRPDVAAKFLRLDEDEAALLEVFLDLRAHWRRRMLDKVEVVKADGGGSKELGESLGIEERRAQRRLWRWGLRELKKEARRGFLDK